MRSPQTSVSSGVGIAPGETVFTRIPEGPSSRASARVRPTSAALEVT